MSKRLKTKIISNKSLTQVIIEDEDGIEVGYLDGLTDVEFELDARIHFPTVTLKLIPNSIDIDIDINNIDITCKHVSDNNLIITKDNIDKMEKLIPLINGK